MSKNVHVIRSVGRTIILTLICFLFLYSFQVPGLKIGTVMPIVGILTIYAVYAHVKGFYEKDNSRTSKMVRSYWIWNVFLLIYVFSLLQINGSGKGTTPLMDYTQMLIILPVFYISGKAIFRDAEELMKILYLGVILQTIIILAALVLPALSIALFMLIPEGGYNSEHFGGIDMIFQYGYHIGLGVFTSAGSIKMAIGQVGACFYLSKSRGSKLFFHLIVFLLISVATSIVSRTGLLISIVGLLVVFFVKSRQKGHNAFKFGVLITILLIIGYFVSIKFINASFIEDTFTRIMVLNERGAKDTYFAGYTGEVGDNVIPPLTNETLIGLGITYGVSGNNITTYTDGGFMRNYSAMGLIVAIINYLLIFLFFLKQYKANKDVVFKGSILFMFFAFIIGEFKESYTYYISPMCFFFLAFYLMEKDRALGSYIFMKEDV